jgi:site-specific DNA-methyltransferase (adenine-specific)
LTFIDIWSKQVNSCQSNIQEVDLVQGDQMSKDVKDRIRIECSGADSLPLDAIEEFQGNLKKRGKKEIDQIITSIQRFGFSFPFFVWRGEGHNYCLDGHGRIQALAELRRKGHDLPLFPVSYIEAKDTAEAKQKLLRLNSQYGAMSVASVLEFTEGLEMDWEELALPEGTLTFKKDQEETTGDDEAPEVPEDPVSQLGEIYELGAHRLMCGDSTDGDQVLKLMDGEMADLVWTDPPYGVSYVGKTSDALKIDNDDLDPAGLETFLRLAFNQAFNASRPGAAWFIAAPPGPLFIPFGIVLLELGVWRQTLVWLKNSLVLGRSDYHYRHESICYGWKPGALHTEPPNRKGDTIWEFDRPSSSREHPTMKPIPLIEQAIKNHTNQKNVVLDLFGGSGSTIIASAKTGRVCRMMELDPKYCDVIRKRWTQWATENGQEVGSGGLKMIEEQKDAKP